MSDIFMRLHPNYESLTDDEKKEFALEKEFIKENYEQLLSICSDYERKINAPVSDRILSYIVRGTWATMLHRRLHQNYDNLVNEEFSAIKNERLVIEKHLPDVIDLWNKNINSGIVDRDEALRLAVKDVWTVDIFNKLYPQYIDSDVQNELRFVMEKEFISENLYEIIRLYNEYVFTSGDKCNPNEKLRDAVNNLWGSSITLQLYSNVSTLSPSQYLLYLNEKEFIEAHISEIMQAYQDCELVMPSHRVRLRNAVDIARVNNFISRLYPDFESIDDDAKSVALVEKKFIEESLGSVLNKYVQFVYASNDDSDGLLREAIDEVWVKSIFDELHPDYDKLSATDMRLADNDRVALRDSLPNIRKKIALYGYFNENGGAISK